MTTTQSELRPRKSFPRYRESLGMVYDTRIETQTAFNGTVTQYTTSDQHFLGHGENVMTTDVVTPGFRTRVARGEVINHPFSSTRVKRSHNLVGHLVQRNAGSGTTIKFFDGGYYCGLPPAPMSSARPSGVPLSALHREAGTQALASVNESSIDGLVELAEAHKVRDTFRLRTQALNKYLSKELARKRTVLGRVSSIASNASSVIESNWLRYRYGIMPLLYLMEDAIVGTRVRTVRSTARGFANWSTSFVENQTVTSTFFVEDWSKTHTYSVEVRAGVMYRPDFSRNQFGISLLDIPSAAWELVPYSFVLDWGLNIGTWIRANTITLGVKQLARWTAVRETYTVTTAHTGSTWRNVSGMTALRYPSGSTSFTVETTNRYPSIWSGITLRRTSLKELPGDKRLYDTYALTMQNLRKLMMRK